MCPRGLGRDVPDLEKFNARRLWADFCCLDCALDPFRNTPCRSSLQAETEEKVRKGQVGKIQTKAVKTLKKTNKDKSFGWHFCSTKLARQFFSVTDFHWQIAPNCS